MKSTNNNLVSSHKKCSGEFGWSYYKDDPLGWFRMFDLIPRFCGKYICTTSGPDCGETVALFQSDLEILYRMTSELLLMRFKRHCPVLNEESEVLAAHKVIIDKRYFRWVIWQANCYFLLKVSSKVWLPWDFRSSNSETWGVLIRIRYFEGDVL